ncbi:calponin homology domain-containing protein DDB_G0272472-like [Episyrphus balteatus]|uniref:calponin homology domain-containing protein DDB_G0272472-like n=1 Tax=Episyrphus balteatus TaxID=286459 RepID=UPI002485186A|nr:calponin homology domain-containing protein DDB_G0272472-like [Episyrphus balteatus]
MYKNSTEIIRKPLGASNKKPIVIKASKYRKMIATITGQDLNKIESEEEQRYKNNLKKGSDELVAKWGRSFKQTQEQKLVDREKKFAEKAQKEKEDYQKIKEKDENIRREKIARAEELVQKLKPGPKELQSAAMQSETLKARAFQRNINKEFEETLKKQSAEKALQMERQAMPWIEEEQRRISNSIQRNNQNKADLLKTINEKARQKAETTAQAISAEKVANSLCDKEIKAQIDREQELLKRKREALRKNALEAMIMVEQRRAREQYQDKLQGQFISIYNEGKKKMEEIKKDHEVHSRQDHGQRNTLNAQKLIALQPDTVKEEENRLRKDISTIQLQFTAQEKEKIQRSRQQKYARIQEYFKELNAQKERDQRKIEENRFALANRLKNDEVNAAFLEKQKQDKIQNAQAMRKALAEQVEERKIIEAEEKENDKQLARVRFEKEDKFFFDYANKLVADAVKKDRPLYPFVKAINQYKKDNEIDVDRKLPRHLESHLRIGVKTPENEMAGSSGKVAPSIMRKYGIDELKSLNGYSARND